jgi:phosphate:Na+ symporter
MRDAAWVAARFPFSAWPGHAADDASAARAHAMGLEAVHRVREAGYSAVEDLERAAKALADLKAAHRRATFEMVASGKLAGSAAIARVDAVALLNRLAHHAWRAVSHLERAAASRMEIEQ